MKELGYNAASGAHIVELTGDEYEALCEFAWWVGPADGTARGTELLAAFQALISIAGAIQIHRHKITGTSTPHSFPYGRPVT